MNIKLNALKFRTLIANIKCLRSKSEFKYGLAYLQNVSPVNRFMWYVIK